MNQIHLTKREYDILQRANKSKYEAAWELGISPNTVMSIWQNMRRKFNAKNREEIIIKALRMQLIDIYSFLI